MIELHITKTCMFATRGRNAGWQRYDTERKAFPDMAATYAWLRETYGTSKRAPMYRDQKNGAPLCVGYVIGFRAKWRDKRDPIAEQHWIEFRECRPVDPTKGRAP